MIFRQLFDSVSGTYSYLLASRSKRSPDERSEIRDRVTPHFATLNAGYGSATNSRPPRQKRNETYLPKISPSYSMICAEKKYLSSPSRTALYS